VKAACACGLRINQFAFVIQSNTTPELLAFCKKCLFLIGGVGDIFGKLRKPDYLLFGAQFVGGQLPRKGVADVLIVKLTGLLDGLADVNPMGDLPRNRPAL
jgi:hypothetical protein